MTTICISFPNTLFKRLKNHCNLSLTVQLIIKQNWFRQTEKTLSHYLSQWWSRPMVHIWVSRIDWVDYFTVLGKYIHAEKDGTVWAHEWYLHPHSWKWTIPTPRVGSGRGTGWPYFVKSPLTGWGGSVYLHWMFHPARTYYNAIMNIMVRIERDYTFKCVSTRDQFWLSGIVVPVSITSLSVQARITKFWPQV